MAFGDDHRSPSGALSGLRGALKGATGVAPDEPLVYVGGPAQIKPSDLRGDAIIAKRRKGGHSLPKSRVQAQFYEWDEAERARWGQYLVEIGRIDPEEITDFEILRDEWMNAVEEAERFTAAGKKITPRDAARLMGAEGAITGKEPARFSGRKTSTSKQINLTSPEDARGLINDVLRNQLGREARPEEVDEFIKVLNTAERQNPVLQTTHTDYVDGNAVNQTSESSGGLGSAGAAQVLTDQARRKPEYGAYQATTRLWNALMSDLIQAPV